MSAGTLVGYVRVFFGGTIISGVYDGIVAVILLYRLFLAGVLDGISCDVGENIVFAMVILLLKFMRLLFLLRVLSGVILIVIICISSYIQGRKLIMSQI